jgi:Flp pilus assembly protein TadG
MKRINPLSNSRLSETEKERGAVLIMVTVLLIVFLGFAALALDVSHLYVVKNELQNAADAGALAGAHDLYLNDGTAVNPGANQTAYDAAVANFGMNVAVEVKNHLTNAGDVQRGHWSFATQSFTANDSLLPVDLWDATNAELDANLNFINAVRVFVRREDIPTKSFFAGLFGYDSVAMGAEAVAYLGFAGNTETDQVDQPIAICSDAITSHADGSFTCSRGRMLNSSGSSTTNTGGWTNFEQRPCETASTTTIRPYVGCPNDPIPGLHFGESMGTTGGVVDNIYRDLRDCWYDNPALDANMNGIPDQSWHIRLPVIECPGSNVGPCSILRGVVEVEVLWIKESGTDPRWEDVPLEMNSSTYGSWSCTHGTSLPGNQNSDLRHECWQQFVNRYNLEDWADTSVEDLTHSDVQKSIFFAPSCNLHVPGGGTGGVNYGILAEIPVLVN